MQPPIFLRPGQEMRRYDIYRKSATKDEKGKIVYGVDSEPVGFIFGSLSEVGGREAELYKQQGHSVTHKIVVRGKSDVQAEDVLKYKGEKYYVKIKHNKANLDMFETIYCEYRSGV